MILSRIIADEVGYFDEGTQWAQDELFGPLGITSVVHDLDDTGVMSGGSAINMTALDFARFGLLYLRGGQWDGDQIVPDGVGRLRADAASPTTPVYGAHWWVVGAEDSSPTSFAGDRVQRSVDHGRSRASISSSSCSSNEPGLRPDLVAARIAPGVRRRRRRDDVADDAVHRRLRLAIEALAAGLECSPRPITRSSSRSSTRSTPRSLGASGLAGGVVDEQEYIET